MLGYTFSSFFKERTFCHASRIWGAKSTYFSWRTTHTCRMLAISVIFNFASTIALATSLMYLVRFSVLMSFKMLSFWASVKFLSFLTNAVFFLMLESNFEKWDSSGRFWIVAWILLRSFALWVKCPSISAIASLKFFY